MYTSILERKKINVIYIPLAEKKKIINDAHIIHTDIQIIGFRH